MQNIMLLGPHGYFGRRLCTLGDDTTVDDTQACMYVLASFQGAWKPLLHSFIKATEAEEHM